MQHTKLQNPEERKSQYIEAIRFYLKETDCKILFVENSNTPLNNHFEKEIAEGRLELLSFNGNNYNKQLGKGFGEMLIIEHAIQFSDFIKETAFLYKITGRYRILNVGSFIKDCICDHSNNLIVDFKENLTFADSRLIGCSPNFLTDFLLRYRNQLNDSAGFYFEHALSKASLQAISENYRYSPLRYKPRFAGIYGTDNTKYNDSWAYWFPRNLKYKLKNLLSN